MRRNRDRVHVTTLVLAGLLAGLLIWSKLRLVTDIPRSAFADPREVEAATENDAAADSTPDTVNSAQPMRDKQLPIADECCFDPDDQTTRSEPTTCSCKAAQSP